MNKNLLLITLTIICVILSVKLLFKSNTKGDFFVGTWTGVYVDSIVVKKAGKLYLSKIYFGEGQTNEYYTKFQNGCLYSIKGEDEVFACPNDVNSIFFGESMLWRKVDE